MIKQVFVVSSVVLAMVVLAGSFGASGNPPRLAAAIEAQQAEALPPAGPGMHQMAMMHEHMMADIKAADTRLDQLVTDLNAATGDARIDALVRVVNELAGQQKAMHGRMAAMHEHMMGGGPHGKMKD